MLASSEGVEAFFRLDAVGHAVFFLAILLAEVYKNFFLFWWGMNFDFVEFATKFDFDGELVGGVDEFTCLSDDGNLVCSLVLSEVGGN